MKLILLHIGSKVIVLLYCLLGSLFIFGCSSKHHYGYLNYGESMTVVTPVGDFELSVPEASEIKK